ncbi:hypothetical protein LCGC14_3039770 [marine sediment metagenome]|uniref:Uncharacterized protein n=1 Tax=marine sediment metagenome TaxID=412755 RepID=A0A0F8WPU0_9ZZZZ
MGSSTYLGGSHLIFGIQPPEKGLKLRKYKVFNDKLGQDIGIIHWRGGWRQYVFQAITHYPTAIEKINGKKYIMVEDILKIDMSRSCHKEIDKFIDSLMRKWKESQNKKKFASLEKDGGKK